MAQIPCYSGSEVLFECGGAYAGTCNTTSGSCLCNDGWSGHSDIVPLDTSSYGGRVLSCPVHVATIKVLWALTLLPLASTIYLYPSSFKTAWATFLRKRRTDPLQYTIIFNALCMIPLYMVSLLTLAVLKLADNGGTALVGVHVAPTSLFALNTFCFISMGLLQMLRALKGAFSGAVHLPSTAGGGDRQKTLDLLYAIVIAVMVPCLFQDVPLLVSTAFPPEIPVDGAPLDAKRVAAVVWICVQMVAVIGGGALSWYTGRRLTVFFQHIFQFSTTMNDSTRLRVSTLRDSSVEAQRGMVKICGIMLLVGLVVRVPAPWWTATQSYWLPISKCLQAINVYKASRVFTTTRVDAVGRVRRMTSSRRMTNTTGNTTTGSTMGNTTMGSTHPDMTGGPTASVSPTIDFKSTSRAGTAKASGGRSTMMVIQPPGGHGAPW